MARISIEELYRSEGGGAKYGVGGIMGAVMQEIMIRGVPNEYDERTYIELLIVKHTLKAAGSSASTRWTSGFPIPWR